MSRPFYILTITLAIVGNIAQWGACCPVGSLDRCAALSAIAEDHQHAGCGCHDDAASHPNESNPATGHDCSGDPLLYIDAAPSIVERDLAPAGDLVAMNIADHSIQTESALASLFARTRSPDVALPMRAELPVYRL